MNNILITGGTGFIGQSIISELMSSNGANTITSLSRDWVKTEAAKRRHNWVNFFVVTYATQHCLIVLLKRIKLIK